METEIHMRLYHEVQKENPVFLYRFDIKQCAETKAELDFIVQKETMISSSSVKELM